MTGNKTAEDIQTQRDNILENMLPDVPFTGWTAERMINAAARAGYAPEMAAAVFPAGLPDIVAHFADWADRAMMAALADTNPDDLRIRDRVAVAVMARLDALAPHREAVRAALSYWSMPHHAARAGGVVWRTADRIWDWAGDTATDYNRYSKRTLLCGVIGSTTLAWLGETGLDRDATRAFLDRRIENVMQCGRIIGKIKGLSFGRKRAV